jgi:uncharacterized membrane protein YbhN (UPF0104 family)
MFNWRLLAKIAITTLILVVLAWQLDFHSAFLTLSKIAPLAAIGAVGVIFLQTICTAQRFVMVLSRFSARMRLVDSFTVTIEGIFFSQTFLSFLGGDALRIWRVRRLGLSLGDATSAVLLDRLIGILVNHLFLLASLPWLLGLITDYRVRLVLVGLALAGIFGFAAVVGLGVLRGRGGYLHRLRGRVHNRRLGVLLVEASSVGRHFLTDFGQMSRILLLTVLIAGANILFFALILAGMNVDFWLALKCAVLVPAILEITMLPISFAGWGVREGAAIVSFGALGLPASLAVGSSIAFGLTGTLVALVGGITWLTDRHRKVVMLGTE